PGKGALEEGCGALFFLVRQDLGISEPGRIIDGDVDEVPTAMLVSRPALASDAVADPVETAQFLDIEMDEFAGPFPLVTHHGGLLLQESKAPDPKPAQPAGDGGALQTQPMGNGASG